VMIGWIMPIAPLAGMLRRGSEVCGCTYFGGYMAERKVR
jgi:hypothetical protein